MSFGINKGLFFFFFFLFSFGGEQPVGSKKALGMSSPELLFVKSLIASSVVTKKIGFFDSNDSYGLTKTRQSLVGRAHKYY
jgi:hypothetical protein